MCLQCLQGETSKAIGTEFAHLCQEPQDSRKIQGVRAIGLVFCNKGPAVGDRFLQLALCHSGLWYRDCGQVVGCKRGINTRGWLFLDEVPTGS